MVTLQYGAFVKWTGKYRHHYYWTLKKGSWASSSVAAIPRQAEKGTACWKVIWWQEWGLFLLEHLFHNAATMRRREWQQHTWRCSHSHQIATAKGMAPEHPLVRSLLGSMDDNILEIAEQVFWGQYEVALSSLLHRHQEQLMTELHDELGQCLTRAGLWEAPGIGRFLSRGRRCSHACSSSQSQLPSPG